MIIQFTLQGFMAFLLSALGVIALVLIILILWNIFKTSSAAKKFLKLNEEAIQKTMDAIPELTENLKIISDDLKDSTNLVKTSVSGIVDGVESITSKTKNKINSLGFMSTKSNQIDYFEIIEGVLQIVSRIFKSRK